MAPKRKGGGGEGEPEAPASKKARNDEAPEEDDLDAEIDAADAPEEDQPDEDLALDDTIAPDLSFSGSTVSRSLWHRPPAPVVDDASSQSVGTSGLQIRHLVSTAGLH
jgi:hypothetical protein